MAKFLASDHVLRFSDQVVVFGKPSPETVARAAARVANTAQTMRLTLKAEFPDFATPQLMSCLQLRTDLSAARRADNVTHILRQMQWPLDAEGRCLQQYRAAYGQAVARAAQGKQSDIDVWAQIITDEPDNKDLNRFLMIVLGLLVVETECERNFASDQKSHSADRGHAAPITRKQTMKVRLDGPPLHELIDEEPSGRAVSPLTNFFHCIQKRYTKRFGSKRLSTVRIRCDVGKQVKKKLKRHGKKTATGFRFERRKSLGHVCGSVAGAAGSVAGAAGPAGSTVFGTPVASAADMQNLRVELRSGTQDKVIEAAGKKFEEKQKSARDLFRKVPGAKRHSQAPSAIVRNAKKRRVNTLKRALKDRWISKWPSAQEMIRKLGGAPLVFVHDRAHCGNPARTFSGGRTVQSILFSGQTLADFVRCPDARARRIILVPSLAQPPVACSLAAVLLGACVQSKLLGHFARYKKLPGHAFACTRGAQRAHPDLWNLIKAYSEAPDFMKCKILTVARAAEQLRANIEAKPKSQPWARLTILVTGPGDAEVGGISARASKALRTFGAFVTEFSKVADT